MTSFFSEQAAAKQDKENDERANVQSEQSAVEKNQKQNYNPQNIAAGVAFVWSVVASATTKTSETAK